MFLTDQRIQTNWYLGFQINQWYGAIIQDLSKPKLKIHKNMSFLHLNSLTSTEIISPNCIVLNFISFPMISRKKMMKLQHLLCEFQWWKIPRKEAYEHQTKSSTINHGRWVHVFLEVAIGVKVLKIIGFLLYFLCTFIRRGNVKGRCIETSFCLQR